MAPPKRLTPDGPGLTTSTPSAPQRYLITGGAGFIGSHLAEELLKEMAPGSEIRVLDNLSSGKEANLAPLGDRVQLIRGDIRDAAAVAQAMEGVSTVFHLAAMTSAPLSVLEPVLCTEINVVGTLNLLEAAKDAGARRFIMASSAAVYGENPVTPKCEDLAPDCRSPYAGSKLMGEVYLRMYGQLHGLETVAFRFFNVFGPRQDPGSQYGSVIPRFIQAVVQGRSPTVYGDGNQTRDFVFVKDIARANLMAARAERLSPGAVYNVGTGRSTSLNDLLRIFGERLGRDPKPIHEPSMPGDIRHSLADVSRIRDELGFVAQVPIEDGLRQTVDWFLTQPAFKGSAA